MKAYKGNFIRRSGRLKDYFVSKAIDSRVKKPTKLKYMAKEYVIESLPVCLIYARRRNKHEDQLQVIYY